MTKNNDLGLASVNVQKGDIVCILYGCSVPVVLRRLGAEDYHKLKDKYMPDLGDGKNPKAKVEDNLGSKTGNSQKVEPTNAQNEFSDFTNECFLHGAVGGYF